MPLTDPNYFRETHTVTKEVTDVRLGRFIGQAARRLRAWVGAQKYAEALAVVKDGEIAPAAAALELRETLELAESYLAMHFAARSLNTPMSPRGIAHTEKGDGDVILQYLKPSEVAQVIEACLHQAEEIAREYLLADGTPSPPFEFPDA